MDPFSITVGVAGLAQIIASIVTYLRHIQSGSTKIQAEIHRLDQEISTLETTNVSIIEMWKSKCDPDGSFESNDKTSLVDSIWTSMGVLLERATETIEELEKLLKEVLGKQGALRPSKLGNFMAVIRKENRYREYTQVRQSLTNYQAGILMLFMALNTCDQLVCILQENKADLL